MASVEEMPEHVEGIMDDFTYQLSLMFQRANIWLGYGRTIFLHLQSTVNTSLCFLKRTPHTHTHTSRLIMFTLNNTGMYLIIPC